MKRLLRSLSLSVVGGLLLAFQNVSATVYRPGLIQAKFSSANSTTMGGTILTAANRERTAGVLMADVQATAGNYATVAGTNVVTGTKWYWDSANSAFGYAGQMYFQAGKTYTFGKYLDDAAKVLVGGVQILNDVTYNNWVTGKYTPATTGWVDVEFRVFDGSGGKGPTGTAGDGNWGTDMGLAFNTTSLTNRAPKASWSRLLDAGDFALLRAATTNVYTTVIHASATADESSFDIVTDAPVASKLTVFADNDNSGDLATAWGITSTVFDVPAGVSTNTVVLNTSAFGDTFWYAVRLAASSMTLVDGFEEWTTPSRIIGSSPSCAISSVVPGHTNVTATLSVDLLGLNATQANLYLEIADNADMTNAQSWLVAEGITSVPGSFTATRIGLAPMTTYFLRATVTNDLPARCFSAVSSFTTKGPAEWGTASASGSVVSGIALQAVLTDAGAVLPTVSCWFGTSPSSLAQIASWTDAVAGTYVTTNSAGLAYGTTYYYAFKAVNAYGESWTTTNSYTTASTFVWTAGGGADTDWSTAANWDVGLVPVPGVSVLFPMAGKTITSLGTTLAVNGMTVNASGEVTFDLGGSTLTTPIFNMGTNLVTTFTLKNTTLNIGSGGLQVSQRVNKDQVNLLGGAKVTTSSLNIGRGYSSNSVVVNAGASLVSTNGVSIGSTAGGVNSLYVYTGGVFSASSLTLYANKNSMVVDGGVVTNLGWLVNCSRNGGASEGNVDVINGGYLKQVGSLVVCNRYSGAVRIMNGGVADTGYINVGGGDDGGNYATLIVSNATLTASGTIASPGDNRYNNSRMYVYEDAGRSTAVTVTGGLLLASSDTTSRPGSGNHNRLYVNGGALSISGALALGGTPTSNTNNWLQVTRSNSRITAATLTVKNYSGLNFTLDDSFASVIPVTISGNGTIDATTKLVIDGTACYLGGKFTLIKSTGGTLTSSIPNGNISVTTRRGYTYAVSQTTDNSVSVRIVAVTVILIK